MVSRVAAYIQLLRRDGNLTLVRAPEKPFTADVVVTPIQFGSGRGARTCACRVEIHLDAWRGSRKLPGHRHECRCGTQECVRHSFSRRGWYKSNMTISRDFDICMPDGAADAVLFRPEGSGRWPGVMHLPDIGGIRQAHRDMAARLAGEGFVVLLPNVFYRTARSPLPRKQGETPEEFAIRFAALTDRLTPEAIAGDTAAYVDTLAASEWVDPGAPLGVVGYCYTGAFAMRVAAARPDRIAAAASFHGGRLVTDTPGSPHLLLPRIQARLYFGHAVQDRSMPEEAIRKLEEALAAWGGKFESETYEGAYHSWTVPDSPVYHAPQAERAYGKLRELMQTLVSA